MKQCGTCKHKPELDEFKKCKVVLYNYTVIKTKEFYKLKNDLTGEIADIRCMHWEEKT